LPSGRGANKMVSILVRRGCVDRALMVDLEMVRFWFQGLEPRTRTSGSAVLIYKDCTAPRLYAALSRFEPHGAAIA
ncbi:unnamed protein product, partial [Penicillium salamii]